MQESAASTCDLKVPDVVEGFVNSLYGCSYKLCPVCLHLSGQEFCWLLTAFCSLSMAMLALASGGNVYGHYHDDCELAR